MLKVFANMFSTATRSEWEAPMQWKLDERQRFVNQQQREAEEWRRRALRDVGMF